MKRLLFLVAALAASLTAARESDFVLYEWRGMATACAALRKIDPELEQFPGRGDCIDELVRSLDLHVFCLWSSPGEDNPYLLPGDSASVAAFENALAGNGWQLREKSSALPDGWRSYVKDGNPYPVLHVAMLDGRLVLFSHPNAFKRVWDILPSLPPAIPAEGLGAVRHTGFSPPSGRSNFIDSLLAASDGLSIGLGLDGDTVVLHVVLEAPPGSPLADWLRSIPPIPDAAACVNLPDAVATFALAPLPPPPDGLFAPGTASFLARHAGTPVSAALLQPALLESDGPPVPFLAFAGVTDAAARLDSRFGPLLTNAVHRGIAMLSPSDVSAPLPDSTGWEDIRHILRMGSATNLAFAAMPSGILAAVSSSREALPAAIDEALDGTLPSFESSAAFREAFPRPDARAVAILHHARGLDLMPIINPFYEGPRVGRDGGPPLAFDLFAYVTPDASLAIRIRYPLALVKAFAGPSGANSP